MLTPPNDARAGNVMMCKKAWRKWLDELEMCEDESTLDAFLYETQSLVERFKEVIPEWVYGGGDVPGIYERINERRKQCR